MVKGSRVLVTGGSGFLGQHIVKHLQLYFDDVAEIRVLDLIPYQQKLDFDTKVEVKSYEGSITDLDVLCRACRKVDAVIHAASLIDSRFLPNIEALKEINIRGTETVIKACLQENVKYLVYCGSISAVQGYEEVENGNESTLPVPSPRLMIRDYGGTKYYAQGLVKNADGKATKDGVLSQVVKNTRCISRANVVYMIPGTTDNLSSETFPALESFLIDLTNYFGIQKNGFNIGLMMYGKEPVVTTELKPFKTQKQINTRVSLMSKRKQYANRLDGPENLSLAIQRMVKMFDLSTQKAPDFNFLLPVPTYNIAVLFVNGSKNFDQYALQAATEAKNRGIVIYVVSYGKNGVDMLPLDLATDRCKAYTVDDYPVGLSNLVSKIGNSICEVTDRQLENVTRPDSSNNCNALIVYEPPPLENNIVCRREEELFPDVHNCAYFYKCHLGIPTRLKCQVGDVFDSRTQTCNYKDAVSCYSQISCPRETGLFPYPGDCFKFLNCFRGISYVLTCPKGLMFDKVSKRCLRPGETFC